MDVGTSITRMTPCMRFRLFLLLLFAASGADAQSFAELQAAVQTADAAEQTPLVNDFLSQASVPHLENDTTAVFLWKGSASSMTVSGDMTGWSAQGWAMQRLASTDLWYRVDHFEPDARLDYKLIRNGSSWILDPRNPATVPGGFGANSELAMPGYEQPWEIIPDSSVPPGSLASHTFASTLMGNSRTVRVYLPAGYDADRAAPYPVILYHDGSDYTNLASIKTVLDNLIAAGRIEPIVAVFANPLDREAEYATSRTAIFTRLVVEELMPWVDSTYHVSTDPARRAVTGPSYAGLASARHCVEHPEVFGLCAPFSPSFWVSNGALLTTMAQRDLSSIKWYLDWGAYEPSIASTGRLFEGMLADQGATFVANEWHEGHSWGSWRAHQDNMLEFFFPGANATSSSSLLYPIDDLELDVYPNPSAGPTTISIETASSGVVRIQVVDMLGRTMLSVRDSYLPSGTNNLSLAGDHLPQGAYMVRVQTTTNMNSIPLLIVR